MNLKQTFSFGTLMAAAWFTRTTSVEGAPFKYSYTNRPPEVLIGFRSAQGSSQIVADLGPVTQFTLASQGSVVPVTVVSPIELKRVFSSLDQLQFSIFATEANYGVTNPPVYQTLWVSRFRTVLNTQSAPWGRKTGLVQGNTSVRIRTLGSNLVPYSLGLPDGPDNDGNLVVIPSGNQFSYGVMMGTPPNFSGTFQGNPEALTPTGFSAGTDPVRLDFYELDPGSGPSTYLGYFDLHPDGTLNFTAGGASTTPAPAPVIQGIVRSGITNSISFTTASGPYQYTLQKSPVIVGTVTWTSVGVGVTGTGTPQTLTDADDGLSAYYRVVVAP